MPYLHLHFLKKSKKYQLPCVHTSKNHTKIKNFLENFFKIEFFQNQKRQMFLKHVFMRLAPCCDAKSQKKILKKNLKKSESKLFQPEFSHFQTESFSEPEKCLEGQMN